jgi:hypothetical protein
VIVVVPADTPVAMPVAAIIVPMAGVALLHTPPETAFVSMVPAPTQTEVVPPMAGGVAITVTVVVAIHPEGAT